MNIKKNPAIAAATLSVIGAIFSFSYHQIPHTQETSFVHTLNTLDLNDPVIGALFLVMAASFAKSAKYQSTANYLNRIATNPHMAQPSKEHIAATQLNAQQWGKLGVICIGVLALYGLSVGAAAMLGANMEQDYSPISTDIIRPQSSGEDVARYFGLYGGMLATWLLCIHYRENISRWADKCVTFSTIRSTNHLKNNKNSSGQQSQSQQQSQKQKSQHSSTLPPNINIIEDYEASQSHLRVS